MSEPNPPPSSDSSSESAPQAAEPRQEGGLGGRGRLSLRNWRVPTKLVAVLAIPTVAFLTVAGVNVAASVQQSRALDKTAEMARLGRPVTALVHELQSERDLTAGYIASGRTGGYVASGRESGRDTLKAKRESVDRAVFTYRKAQEALARSGHTEHGPQFAAVSEGLDGLTNLRESVEAGTLTERAIFHEYSAVVAALLDLEGEISRHADNEEFDRTLHALQALSQAKELATQVRGTLYPIAYRDSFAFEEFQEFADLRAERESAFDNFQADASEGQRALYTDTVKGQASLARLRIEREAASRQSRASLDVNPVQWFAASTTEIELMRTAETRVLDLVIDKSSELSASAQRATVMNGAAVALILAVALLTSLVVARSMARSLRRLRASALEVAQRRLPAAIEELRTNESGDLAVEVTPIGIDSKDEIGEVAAAFDAIHEEAVRLATEQAVLRSNVNAMFVNLSRRSQGLVERQLRLIDELEGRERNPAQLEDLFKLDHLATRMRRNDESLLVLAGSESARRWTEPVPLSDILLAAIAEVEQYTRIQQTFVSETAIAGHAVSDLVHLLAELLENATTYSPPSSVVAVAGRAIRGGTEGLVEIEDVGMGMTQEAMAEANERLANPPIVDVSVSEQMGLYVVGRLAGRHGIKVSLQESRHGGVIASVSLPPTIVSAERPERGARAATARSYRPAVEPPATRAARHAAPSPTAARQEIAPPGRLLTNPRRAEDILGVSVAAAGAGTAATLPIYDSVSAWFRREPSTPTGRPSTRPTVGAEGEDPPEWHSPADQGWAAAAATERPVTAGTTRSGLPIRVPMAHFVPGSAPAPGGRRHRAPVIAAAGPEPDEVRGVLSSFYQGVHDAFSAETDAMSDDGSAKSLPPPGSPRALEPPRTTRSPDAHGEREGEEAIRPGEAGQTEPSETRAPWQPNVYGADEYGEST